MEIHWNCKRIKMKNEELKDVGQNVWLILFIFLQMWVENGAFRHVFGRFFCYNNTIAEVKRRLSAALAEKSFSR